MVRMGSPVQSWSWAPYIYYVDTGVNMSREIVTLECEVCKRRNYTTTRNKKVKTEKISIKKYCKFDRKHTLHKEIK